MNQFLRFSVFQRASIFVIAIYFFVCILIAGQGIIVPIIYATLFAIMLSPAINFLMHKGLHRALSIVITLLFAIAIIVVLFILLSSQASHFSASLPILIDRFYILLDKAVNNISGSYLTAEAINNWITKTKMEVLNNLSSSLGSTLSAMESTLIIIFLVPVYIFMISFYQPLLMQTIQKISGKTHHEKVNEFLTCTRSLIKSYLTGLLIEFAIVALMYSTGLLLIGIKYAILLGIIGALLNIIPYLGGVIAVSFYMIIAFTTMDSSSVVWVLLLFVVVHFIDNSYIIPKVVASKVKINALVAITAVLIGGAIWGFPGMFISIPLTGVIKLIFDRIEILKPWGFLLGDTMPPIINLKISKSSK